MALERASWILGIDVGKEKLSCALLSKDGTFRCRFDVDASLDGFQMMLESVKKVFADEGYFGKPNREFLAINKIEGGIMYPEGHKT